MTQAAPYGPTDRDTMTTPSNQYGPLSGAEARQFSRYLKRQHDDQQGMTYNQLKGFLFSIGCSPSPLFPNEWLPLVFGNQSQQADSHWVLDCVFRLQQQIDNDIANGNPKLPANARLLPHLKDNFQPGSVLHEWSAGVEAGLLLSSHHWHEADLEDTELWPELESFWSMLTFFSDETLARTLQYNAGVTPPFGKVVELVREQLPWLIKDYACLCQALFEESQPEAGFGGRDLPAGSAQPFAINDDHNDGDD